MSSERNTAGQCPKLEDLAAFVDGRLIEDEAEAIAEHIEACERCREIVTETFRFQDDERNAKLASVVRLSDRVRARMGWWSGLGVAAAAAMALLVVGPRLLDERGPFDAGTIARSLGGGDGPSAAADRYSGEGWTRTRGTSAFLGSEPRAFRLGVRAFDLEVALAAGDRQRAESLLAEIEDLADDLDLSEDSDRRAAIVEAAEVLRQRITDPSAAAPTDLTAAGLGTPLRDASVTRSFDLGQWAEAGRLAVARGDIDHISSRRTLRFGKRALNSDPPEHIASQLGTVVDLLEADSVDIQALGQALDRLLEVGGNL